MAKSGQTVTIKTIAAAMGLSFSTVAKALNHDPVIKKETREAVEQKAREMGYVSNFNAKSLRSRKTNTVGMILNDVENPTFAHMLSVIASDLALMGYTALICDSRYNENVERLNIQAMLARNTDAIIISPVNPDSENLKLLQKIQSNVILMGTPILDFHCNYITVDYELGGYLAAREMLDNGHSNNLVIAEIQTTDTSRQYIRGVRKAYTELGVTLEDDRRFHAIPSVEAGSRILRNYMRGGGTVDGVICGCDSFAWGIYEAAERLQLRIPEDISVVGFDDYAPSQFFAPKLSTVYLPKERMASCCVELLRGILGEEGCPARSVLLEPYLVRRKSILPG